MTKTISNYDDVIDSREIIARIDELEGMGDDIDEDDKAELARLKALAEEAESSPDWRFGETLIRDSYFTEYAQELAEDCCNMPKEQKWPLYCIDWEQAANDLKMDYMEVEFGDITYWIRG